MSNCQLMWSRPARDCGRLLLPQSCLSCRSGAFCCQSPCCMGRNGPESSWGKLCKSWRLILLVHLARSSDSFQRFRHHPRCHGQCLPLIQMLCWTIIVICRRRQASLFYFDYRAKTFVLRHLEVACWTCPLPSWQIIVVLAVCQGLWSVIAASYGPFNLR